MRVKKSKKIFSDSLALEEGTDRLPRNVCEKLPFCVAQNPKRTQISKYRLLNFVAPNHLQKTLLNCGHYIVRHCARLILFSQKAVTILYTGCSTYGVPHFRMLWHESY